LGNYGSDFALDPAAVWVNAAHQGALPRVGAAAAREAVDWKLDPQQLTTERFRTVPERVRTSVARLLGAQAEDVFLSNGSSYGLHLLANGLPLTRGDGVLLMRGDFPSNVLPWLDLRKRGVDVQLLAPARHVLQPAEIEEHLTPATRVVCLSWVHSFSGWTLDIDAIGKMCRDNGTWLIVNATQGLGPRTLDVSRTPVDAVVGSGWKWLCGPYGTGLGWLRRELRETLTYNRRYWLTMQTADDLGTERDATEDSPPDEARRYDIFGTANFFNFHAWGATLDYLHDCGVDAIRKHDQGLVDRLIAGLDPKQFELISPAEGDPRSTLIFLTHREAGRNREIYDRCIAERVHLAFRGGKLRVAPHLYNTDRDIDRVLAALH